MMKLKRRDGNLKNFTSGKINFKKKIKNSSTLLLKAIEQVDKNLQTKKWPFGY